jgi:hypothetical protein
MHPKPPRRVTFSRQQSVEPKPSFGSPRKTKVKPSKSVTFSEPLLKKNTEHLPRAAGPGAREAEMSGAHEGEVEPADGAEGEEDAAAAVATRVVTRR